MCLQFIDIYIYIYIYIYTYIYIYIFIYIYIYRERERERESPQPDSPTSYVCGQQLHDELHTSYTNFHTVHFKMCLPGMVPQQHIPHHMHIYVYIYI
jgi:hypothetical protein